jgi:hypothetical protein
LAILMEKIANGYHWRCSIGDPHSGRKVLHWCWMPETPRLLRAAGRLGRTLRSSVSAPHMLEFTRTYQPSWFKTTPIRPIYF